MTDERAPDKIERALGLVLLLLIAYRLAYHATYLGEVALCIPLFDPEARLAALKRQVAVYPEALRRAVIQDYLWMADFGLAAFAPKFAQRGDSYGTAACLTRAVHQLVLVLFAVNRRYPMNDKTALAEVAEFDRAPQEFAPRAQKLCPSRAPAP